MILQGQSSLRGQAPWKGQDVAPQIAGHAHAFGLNPGLLLLEIMGKQVRMAQCDMDGVLFSMTSPGK